MKEPLFLTLAEVIQIHNDQIERYGGSYGSRDIRLLESAIAQPLMSCDGEWLHEDVFKMEAAYRNRGRFCVIALTQRTQ